MRNGRRKQRGLKVNTSIGMGMRPRASRHGKPLAEVFTIVPVLERKRGVRMNPETGQAEVYYEETLGARRPMTPSEIEQARYNVRRALRPTGTYGQKQFRRVGPKKAAPQGEQERRR